MLARSGSNVFSMARLCESRTTWLAADEPKSSNAGFEAVDAAMSPKVLVTAPRGLDSTMGEGQKVNNNT